MCTRAHVQRVQARRNLGSDALVQLPAALVKEFQGLCNLLIVPAGGIQCCVRAAAGGCLCWGGSRKAQACARSGGSSRGGGAEQ